MRIFVFLILVLCSSYSFAQKVLPYEDMNFFLKSFQNGVSRQVELQRIENIKTGDDLMAYMDFRGNLRVYDGNKPEDLANINVPYEVSDHLLTWRIGEALNMWDNGMKQTLTYNCSQARVMDSIIVYTDNRFNTLNVYQNGEKHTVLQMTTLPSMPVAVGEDVIAYKDNGDFYKIFWDGQSYDIDVWIGSINFKAGTDVVAFNDPTMRTFAVFEKGLITDVEDYFVNRYEAGRGFVVYMDLNNNLYKFENGERKLLSSFADDNWQVKDDVVIWRENSFWNMYAKGKTWQICNYPPQNIQLKNDVMVFTNSIGGVSVSHDGKVVDLTNQQECTYSIHGSSVKVNLFNKSYVVYQNGTKYQL